MTDSISARQRNRPTAAQITIREDAPSCLCEAISLIAKGVGMRSFGMREVICDVLLVLPEAHNWSEYPGIWGEVVWHMENAQCN